MPIVYLRRDAQVARDRLHHRRMRNEDYVAGYRMGLEAAHKANTNVTINSKLFVRGFAAGLHFGAKDQRRKAHKARKAHKCPDPFPVRYYGDPNSPVYKDL